MDHLLPVQRSKMMSNVRRSGTALELAVRTLLTDLGYRYRTNLKGLPGTPDLAFTKRRAVIFVHGCFWHGHACRLARLPETRADFWSDKIMKNRARDEKAQLLLKEGGWKVLTIWQCELRERDALVIRLVEFLGPTKWQA